MSGARRNAVGPASAGALTLVLALVGAGSGLAQTAGSPPASAATPAAPPPPAATSAPPLEPYRFNARERTARALAAWEKGKPEDAVAPLDSALRLKPGDPLAEFNAGTAHLGARQSDAGTLLEQAAKHAPADLAADALYNLGNARLEAQDARARSTPTRARCGRSPINRTPSAISSSPCACSKSSRSNSNSNSNSSSRRTSNRTRTSNRNRLPADRERETTHSRNRTLSSSRSRTQDRTTRRSRESRSRDSSRRRNSRTGRCRSFRIRRT